MVPIRGAGRDRAAFWLKEIGWETERRRQDTDTQSGRETETETDAETEVYQREGL